MLDKKRALKQLQNEADDVAIYSLLEASEKVEENKKILRKLITEERRHYAFCQKITGESRSANLFKVIFYTILVKIFGTSFTLKFMESREEYPEARDIYEEEMNHENSLISMLKDTKLVNAGGIVLGMNDALVELTGTLSGIALAFSNTKSVGATGLIMGVAAALSMAGSAYLESKENPSDEIKPLTYSLYTGGSYIITTAFLILPFFIFTSGLYAVLSMFFFALVAIITYNFYISVAKELKFLPRVIEMCVITFGVAIISFGIGFLVKHYFGLDV